MSFPILMWEDAVAREYQVPGTPFFYAIDRKGLIASKGFVGEVYSLANSMGVSGCLDNQYRDANKVWHYYMYTHKHEDYPYHVVPLPPYSWQVYGGQ